MKDGPKLNVCLPMSSPTTSTAARLRAARFHQENRRAPAASGTTGPSLTRTAEPAPARGPHQHRLVMSRKTLVLSEHPTLKRSCQLYKIFIVIPYCSIKNGVVQKVSIRGQLRNPCSCIHLPPFTLSEECFPLHAGILRHRLLRLVDPPPSNVEEPTTHAARFFDARDSRLPVNKRTLPRSANGKEDPTPLPF